MKKSEIKVGGHYEARVSQNLVTVRVDSIGKQLRGYPSKETTVYNVTNLKTGRKLGFRSAAKFRREINVQAEFRGSMGQASS